MPMICRGYRPGKRTFFHLTARRDFKLARFGLFNSGQPRPVRTYEGDRVIQYVQIVNDKPGNNVELVATIKLDATQSVKPIE